MAEEKKISTTLQVTCDSCGKVEEVRFARDLSGWIRITVTESGGLRVYEKRAKKKRFETFHLIQDRNHVDFCSRVCAVKVLEQSTRLFISEVSPETNRKKFREL